MTDDATESQKAADEAEVAAERDASGEVEQEPEAEAEPGPGTGEVEEPDPLQSAQEEAARLRDQLLRTAADFDNFRKRARREEVQAEARGRETLLRDLLPVFDNLERAVAHSESATDVEALADGIRMVMRQFTDTLQRLGIERVPSVGAPFDPAVHEAIQHLETIEHAPGTVAAEVQGGYRFGDRLVRPALVVVAKAPVEAAGGGGSPEDAGDGSDSGDGAPNGAAGPGSEPNGSGA